MFGQQVRNLRIGGMVKTILPALAHAVVFYRKCTTDPVVSLEAIKSQLQVLSEHSFSYMRNIYW
jgi:DNA ligase 1